MKYMYGQSINEIRKRKALRKAEAYLQHLGYAGEPYERLMKACSGEYDRLGKLSVNILCDLLGRLCEEEKKKTPSSCLRIDE